MVSWLCIAVGLTFSAIFLHEFATSEDWPPPGRDVDAWLSGIWSIGALLAGLHLLKRGPSRNREQMAKRTANIVNDPAQDYDLCVDLFEDAIHRAESDGTRAASSNSCATKRSGSSQTG
jgi:hypothetical protein